MDKIQIQTSEMPEKNAREASGSGLDRSGGQNNFFDLENLKQAGRYEISGRLGRGSSGTVFLAWDPLIKRQVAIKMSRPLTEKARKSFFLEAESAGKLNHPNIVAVYDTNLHEKYCYIVMEYIDGNDLSHYCTPNNLLSIRKVAEIVTSAGRALDYAHKDGVIHKDIKPSNIMLDNLGTVKITDFSIAQQIEKKPGPAQSSGGGRSKSAPKTTRDLFVTGTPSYMSPEQLSNQVVSRESDIFSLGCVLYELLTGIKAFSGNSLLEIAYKIIHEDPLPVSTLNDKIPKDFDRIIQTVLAKNPVHRYVSCNDLAYHMKSIVDRMETGTEEAQDFFDLVHNISFFQAFTKDQVRELVAASNIIRIPKGKIIISEGDADDTFYILLSGKVKVQKGDRFIAFLESGECFGEMAHLSGQARTATVIAETGSSLIKIRATALHKWPDYVQLLFYQRFAKTLATRLVISQSKLP
ncbi:MAG: protein kinase [Deltaproteobacteria bacterium]|nr:protein kinase [Deltaproteobacteria bacterium]